MYWPIGHPKTYAVFKQTTVSPSSNLTISTDGLDKTPEAVAQDATTLGTSSLEDAEADATDGSYKSSPLFDTLNLSADQQGIVHVGIARGGHLFATITRSSLTVWQTKASHLT